MEHALTAIWEFLNSPTGLVVMATALAYGLARLYAAKPSWREYEGTIIAAIKYAEKAIPDGVENRSLARLDEAMRYVLKVYGEANAGRTPTAVDVQRLRERIQVVHQQLEAAGTL